MKPLILFSLFFLYACSGMPQIADDIEKIADNDAITLKVDKDAFARETDVHIIIDVVNKEPPSVTPSAGR